MKKIPAPKLSLKAIRKGFFYLFIIFGIFSAGFVIGAGRFSSERRFVKADLDRTSPEDVEFSLFWNVWDTLETVYFDKSKLDAAEMVYGAIKGMVAAIGDPYTVFLTPRENKIVQEDLQGNFEGVGIQIGFKGSQLAVISPLEGTPADRAGVKPGDLIVGIKDELKGIDRGTVGISLPEAVQIIRGPAGTEVTLSLIREGEDKPLEITVTRGEIEVESVALNYVGENKNIAHVRINKFGAETTQEWSEAVLNILKNDVKGVIIDVRGNTGGYLQSAVDIASDFLETGEVVVIEETGTGEQTEFVSERIGKLKGRNVVLLVDEGSASASEILAGALRDQIDAPLVGKTTFGKGTIQEPQQIDGGAGLHITIARWLTPNKIWVNEVGLTPDIEIDDNQDTVEDEQLDAAVKLLLGQS